MTHGSSPGSSPGSPPDTDEIWLRAALCSHYDMRWLGVDGELADASGALLFPESTRVRTADGERHWRLNDSTRRSLVRRFPFDRLRSTWSRIAYRPSDDRQWAIDQYVGAAEPVELDTLDLRRLRAVGWLVRWLGDAAPHIPGSDDLAARLGLGELLEPLRALAGDHFVGRGGELARLAAEAPDQPVFVHGIGGVGKSALAVRYLLSAVDTSLVAYLNFDHSALDPAKPASMIASIASQLTAQLDDPRAAALAGACHERLRAGKAGDTLPLVLDLADLVGDRPIVVVFDTYEEVQRRDAFVQRAFAEFLAELWERLPRRSFVLAGRAPAPELRVEHIALTGLDPHDAANLLCRLAPDLSAAAAADKIRQVGSTSPLVIHLMAGVLGGGVRENALRDLTIHRGAIEGELYRRLLGHIRDPDLRRIAHPGLTLRRVTPDLIEKVLAKPCDVRVRDAAHAFELFTGLAREAALVTRTPDGSAVVHRADVRRMMLRRLADDDPEAVRQIHLAAVSFYRTQQGTTARAEELYHRLMLRQTKAVLDKRWDQTALTQLTSSVDELPPASKAYLAAKSDALAVSADDLREAELEVRRRLLIRRVSGMLEVDETLEALHEIDEHTRATGDTALGVMDVKVRALQKLDRCTEARAVAVEARERAARMGANREFVAFTVHKARLLARENRAAEAKPDLMDTLEFCRSLPRTRTHLVDRLTVLVCLLRLRRSGLPLGDVLAGELKREAIDIAEGLPAKELTGDQRLLRGVAAEVGDESPRLLTMGLRTFGAQENVLVAADEDVVLFDHEQIVAVTDTLRVDVEAQMAAELYQESGGPVAAPHSTLPDSSSVLRMGRTRGDTLFHDPVPPQPWLVDADTMPEEMYAQAMHLMNANNPLHARALLRHVVGKADTDPALRARAMIALARLSPEVRHLTKALDLVRQATELIADLPELPDVRSLRAMTHSLHADMLHYTGRTLEAVDQYEQALNRADAEAQSQLLLNRGLAHQASHNAAAADGDLRRALDLAREHGQEHLVATVTHRLGDLRRLTGHLPEALRFYEQATNQYARLDNERVPGLLLDQAKTLLAAGAADQAHRILDDALPRLRKLGDAHLVADAEMTMASVLLLARDFDRAARLAASASRRFAMRHEEGWALVADLVGLRAEFEIERQRGTPRAAVIDRAVQLSDALRAGDLPGEAATAVMLAVRLAVVRGDLDRARQSMAEVPRPGPHAPVDDQVLYRLCRAEIAMAERDYRRASGQIRAGLAELDRARQRMTGLDLLSGTASHGWELGRLAVDMAVTRDRPREVFDWLERSRAQTYRFRVRSDLDPELADVLTELRLVSHARPSGQVTRRRDELQRRANRLGAYTSSLSSVRPAAGFIEVAEALGDRALVSFLDSGDSLAAVVIVDGRTSFVHLGSTADAVETVRRLHADLAVYAPDGLAAPLADAVARSARRHAAALDRQVVQPLAELIGDRDLVVVPTGPLYAVAWGTLPSLTGRPIVVTPSATSWLTAQTTPADSSVPVVLVQGAGLPTYIREVRALGAFHPDLTVLTGAQATVRNTLGAMEGAGLAHVAAHGWHEPGNALFSRLELADGPLFAHDLLWLRRPPHRVVLAASELALSTVRPGDEALGFAGVLLATGVATVVAAVNRIGDAAAAGTMYELHRALAAGVPMARALADATARDPLRRPFVCLGS